MSTQQQKIASDQVRLGSDHRAQAVRARALLDQNDVFVSTTVLLETEWVLRSVYDFAPRQIVTALRAFAGLPRVSIEAPGLAAQALDRAESGLDFADALHLEKAEGCEAFISFDRRFARIANRSGTVKVRLA